MTSGVRLSEVQAPSSNATVSSEMFVVCVHVCLLNLFCSARMPSWAGTSFFPASPLATCTMAMLKTCLSSRPLPVTMLSSTPKGK